MSFVIGPGTEDVDGHQTSTDDKSRLGKIGLRFANPETERSFREHYANEFIPQTRAAILLGVILIFIDTIVDFMAAPEEPREGNILRILGNSVFIIALLGSYVPIIRNHFQAYACLLFAPGSTIFLYAVELTGKHQPPLITGWLGMINYFFLIIFAFLLLGLRLSAAAISGIIITAGYLWITLHLKNVDAVTFLYISYQVSTIYILGLFLGYVREKYIRRDFAAQTALRTANEDADRANSELSRS